MTRHDMKQDDLVSAIEKVSSYATANPVLLRNWGLGAAAAVALIALVFWLMSSRTQAAAALLAEAETRFSAPVVATGANPTGPSPTYPTDAERDRAALESFDRLVSKYGGGPGGVGRYYQGVLQARSGKLDEAVTSLQNFIAQTSGPVLKALAQAQVAEIKVKKGDLDGGAKIFNDLAQDKNGAYPTDWALFYLAGIEEKQGKGVEAAANYQRIVKEFPTSPFATDAGRKAKGAAS
jgi:TolA-binding protein